jgi:hypothetical protein
MSKLSIVAPVSLALYLSLPAINAFAGAAGPNQPQAPMFRPGPQPTMMQQGAMGPNGRPVILDVTEEEQRHKAELEKKEKAGRLKGWGPSVWINKMKHKWHKPDQYEDEKKKIDVSLGGFETAFHVYNATTCAVSLMEKHYAGVASFKLGAGYLKDVQDTMMNMNPQRNSSLQAIHAMCKKALDGYKLEKKGEQIERTKVFSEDQRHDLDNYISGIFSATPEVVPVLQRAYESNLDCHNPKGLTLGVAFGIGGYAGFYRQMCKSPLGQRYTIYRAHGGPALGIGGVATMSFLGANYTRDLKEPNQSHTFHVRADGSAGVAFIGGAAAEGTISGGTMKKAGQTAEEREQNISKPTITASPATGAGIYAGAGVEVDKRSNTGKPDYAMLFKAMRIYK